MSKLVSQFHVINNLQSVLKMGFWKVFKSVFGKSGMQAKDLNIYRQLRNAVKN